MVNSFIRLSFDVSSLIGEIANNDQRQPEYFDHPYQ